MTERDNNLMAAMAATARLYLDANPDVGMIEYTVVSANGEFKWTKRVSNRYSPRGRGAARTAAEMDDVPF
jgi:hypothetical protein